MVCTVGRLHSAPCSFVFVLDQRPIIVTVRREVGPKCCQTVGHWVWGPGQARLAEQRSTRKTQLRKTQDARRAARTQHTQESPNEPRGKKRRQNIKFPGHIPYFDTGMGVEHDWPVAKIFV
jgi:hypothetical protein